MAETHSASSLINSKTNDDKFMKFLEANCMESERQWAFLIHKNFLKEKHVKLIYEICKNNHLNSKSPSYIYELCKRELYLDDYDHYLNDVPVLPEGKVRVNANFVLNCLILKKLSVHLPNNERIKSLFNMMKEKITEFDGRTI